MRKLFLAHRFGRLMQQPRSLAYRFQLAARVARGKFVRLPFHNFRARDRRAFAWTPLLDPPLYPPIPANEVSLVSRLARTYDESPVLGPMAAWFGLGVFGLGLWTLANVAEHTKYIRTALDELSSGELPEKLGQAAALHARVHFQREIVEVAAALHRVHERLDELAAHTRHTHHHGDAVATMTAVAAEAAAYAAPDAVRIAGDAPPALDEVARAEGAANEAVRLTVDAPAAEARDERVRWSVPL